MITSPPNTPARVSLPPAALGGLARLGARLRRYALRARLSTREVGPGLRRAIDVLVAGTALLLLAPLFLVCAVAIKVDDPGPVLFSQERIGKNGRRFRMLKLRTMIAGADAMKAKLAAASPEAMNGVRFKMARDPRITRVGRVLRKLSIDELPQLYNVVTGDMTLVGPRPAVRSEVDKYGPRELRRLEVPQGLTCLWQVGGRSDLSFEQQVDLDIEYIDTVRAVDELLIVARTIPAVLTGRGAR